MASTEEPAYIKLQRIYARQREDPNETLEQKAKRESFERMLKTHFEIKSTIKVVLDDLKSKNGGQLPDKFPASLLS